MCRGEGGPWIPDCELRSRKLDHPPNSPMAEISGGSRLRNGVFPHCGLDRFPCVFAIMCGLFLLTGAGLRRLLRAIWMVTPILLVIGLFQWWQLGGPTAARIVLNVLICVVAASVLTATTPRAGAAGRGGGGLGKTVPAFRCRS